MLPGGTATWTVLGCGHRVIGPAEEFLEYLRVQGTSPNTVKSYARALAPLLFMAVYAVATVLFLPGSVITLAGGAQSAIRWTKHTLNHWYRAAAPAFEASLAIPSLIGMPVSTDRCRRNRFAAASSLGFVYPVIPTLNVPSIASRPSPRVTCAGSGIRFNSFVCARSMALENTNVIRRKTLFPILCMAEIASFRKNARPQSRSVTLPQRPAKNQVEVREDGEGVLFPRQKDRLRGKIEMPSRSEVCSDEVGTWMKVVALPGIEPGFSD